MTTSKISVYCVGFIMILLMQTWTFGSILFLQNTQNVCEMSLLVPVCNRISGEFSSVHNFGRVSGLKAWLAGPGDANTRLQKNDQVRQKKSWFSTDFKQLLNILAESIVSSIPPLISKISCQNPRINCLIRFEYLVETLFSEISVGTD